MTEGAEKEKQQAKPAPKSGPSPLKGALADVLKKEQVAEEKPMPVPQPKAAPAAESGPYEVPEETLRALFKEGK
jgi:hypothetical protein